MSWRIKGREYESCSCKSNCRCLLGPAEPDQGWCSGALVFSIEEGMSDSVDLRGVKVALLVELPHDMVSGIDKARLVFDEGVTEQQRRQLEAIFQGTRGGALAIMQDAVRKWLTSDVARIEISDDGSPRVEIAGRGVLNLQPLKAPNGEQTVLEHAPVAVAFGFPRMELAVASNTRVTDPEMRAWESLGYGAANSFDLSG